MARISKGNSKLGNIMNISLTPIKACKGLENVCAKDCYAMKAYRQYPAVRKAWDSNTIMANDFPELFFLHINNQLQKYTGKFFRWHTSGDFLNTSYYASVVKLALEFPHIKFLAFTKQYAIVNFFAHKGMHPPKNLTVVFSTWPNYELKNPFEYPVAYLKDKLGIQKIPDDAFECPGSCIDCHYCWDLGFGQSVYF